MDVRCERCKTEYEFDDARITEAGVTVKCTTCGHVFKVKKKALVFTVPVKPDEVAQAAPPPTAAPPQREWKVRQANGNVFTFKELTTLQKWIVERKVTRDDEISLTGESWKRLGNIAELASFFQVVDEAEKARQVAAMQNQAMLGYAPVQPSGSHAMPRVPAGRESGPYPAQTGFPAPPQAPPPPPGAVAQAPMAPEAKPAGPRKVGNETLRDLSARLDEDSGLEAPVKKGGFGAVLVALVLLLLGGGAAYWYFVYEPERLAEKAERERLEAEKAQKAERERIEREKAEAEAKARAEEERKRREEEQKKAAAAAADAGVQVAVAVADAGTGSKKPEPVKDFDYWMARGDRLREAEKTEAALDAYGKAAELGPDRAEPLAGKGMALVDLGMLAQAEAAFQQALGLNPRYGLALMGMAETYKQMGKREQAIQYYEKYLDVLPNGPEAAVARNAIQKLKQ